MHATTIDAISIQMQPFLTCDQMKRLRKVLKCAFSQSKPEETKCDGDLIAAFIEAKQVEGCSLKTLDYYRNTLEKLQESLQMPFTQVETADLRSYLTQYERERGSSKVTIDNIRRIMSSFFSWLEEEDYIVKSPVRRIHRVKVALVIKETFSDEDLETIRESCMNRRDLALVDLLASTGMRVGELVKLNRKDIDLNERECIVLGKGNKQRMVYFDARAKLHLEDYLRHRTDCNPALFVTLSKPHDRLTIGAIELRLRKIGERLDMHRVHPHKFRRTLATYAIGKGMPIEQVQKLLGHAKIDTTMHYAMVNQNNVKASHRRYLE